MFKIFLNEKALLLEKNICLQELLEQEYSDFSFAVALNRTFIPRSQYLTIYFNDGDHVDIITPMQGG